MRIGAAGIEGSVCRKVGVTVRGFASIEGDPIGWLGCGTVWLGADLGMFQASDA